MKYVIRLGHKRLLLSYFILFSLYNIEFNDSLQMCLRKIKATIQKYSKAYIVYIYIYIYHLIFQSVVWDL